MSVSSFSQLPLLRVRVENGDLVIADRTFPGTFRIGRGAHCDIRVASTLVSREHVEVAGRAGEWFVRDLASRNGTFIDGARIEGPVALRGALELRLAVDGPLVRLEPILADAENRRSAPSLRSLGVPSERGAPAAREASTPAEDPSRLLQHYLQEPDSGPAGERTEFFRRVIQGVRHQHRRRSRALLAAAAAAVVLGAAVALILSLRHATERAELSRELAQRSEELQRSREAASEMFFEVRNIQAQIAQLRMLVEESGQTSFRAQIDSLEASRRRLEQRYEGYVEELGLRRSLDPEEQLVYRVARVFNESEFGMPAEFVARVRHTMREYWLSPAGRGRFARGVKRAESFGYTPEIVRTMVSYGLPPQFFYLAMQESDFNVEAIGPLTRWGRAKGMWQFIPGTALRFGLDPGPSSNEGFVERSDDRHDFDKSTDAAARYLRTIYATLAQASGLLVVASYNWGEHRIVNRLDELPGPQAIPESVFADLPESAEIRSYWSFLGRYSDRMPAETKDYVLKIFAAAVIGEDPRRFGFDFDSPLAPYLARQGE